MTKSLACFSFCLVLLLNLGHGQTTLLPFSQEPPASSVVSTDIFPDSQVNGNGRVTRSATAGQLLTFVQANLGANFAPLDTNSFVPVANIPPVLSRLGMSSAGLAAAGHTRVTYVTSSSNAQVGTGSADDPINLSSPTVADAFWTAQRAVTSNALDPAIFYFAPGSYPTIAGINFKSGWKFFGSGQNTTVIQGTMPTGIAGTGTTAGYTNLHFDSAHYYTIYGPQGSGVDLSDIELRDLTVDGGVLNAATYLGGSTLTGGFTIPAQGAAVTVTVASAALLSVNEPVMIQDTVANTGNVKACYGLMTVTAISGTSVTLTNNIGSQYLLGTAGTGYAAPGAPAGTCVLLPNIDTCGVALPGHDIQIDHVTIQNTYMPYNEGAAGLLMFSNLPAKISGANSFVHSKITNFYGLFAIGLWVVGGSDNGTATSGMDIKIDDDTINGVGYYQGIDLVGTYLSTVVNTTIANTGDGIFSDTGHNTYDLVANNHIVNSTLYGCGIFSDGAYFTNSNFDENSILLSGNSEAGVQIYGILSGNGDSYAANDTVSHNNISAAPGVTASSCIGVEINTSKHATTGNSAVDNLVPAGSQNPGAAASGFEANNHDSANNPVDVGLTPAAIVLSSISNMDATERTALVNPVNATGGLLTSAAIGTLADPYGAASGMLGSANIWTGAETFNGAVTFGSNTTITGPIQLRNGSGVYSGTLLSGEGYEDTANKNWYEGDGTTSGGNLMGGVGFWRGASLTSPAGTATGGGTPGAAGVGTNNFSLSFGSATGGNTSGTGVGGRAPSYIPSPITIQMTGSGGTVTNGGTGTGGSAPYVGAGDSLINVQFTGVGGPVAANSTGGNGGNAFQMLSPLFNVTSGGNGGASGTTANGGNASVWSGYGINITGQGGGAGSGTFAGGSAGTIGFSDSLISVNFGSGGAAGTGGVGGAGGGISHNIIDVSLGNGGNGAAGGAGGNGGTAGAILLGSGAGSSATASAPGAAGGAGGTVNVAGTYASGTTPGINGGSLVLDAGSNYIRTSGATQYVINIPGTQADTFAELGQAQTWTGANTFYTGSVIGGFYVSGSSTTGGTGISLANSGGDQVELLSLGSSNSSGPGGFAIYDPTKSVQWYFNSNNGSILSPGALTASTGNVSAPAGNLVVGTATIHSGAGNPNGSIVGTVGDLYLNTSGGSATTLYVKESGSATNTGWIGK